MLIPALSWNLLQPGPPPPPPPAIISQWVPEPGIATIRQIGPFFEMTGPMIQTSITATNPSMLQLMARNMNTVTRIDWED
jgi:hypothetical protein